MLSDHLSPSETNTVDGCGGCRLRGSIFSTVSDLFGKNGSFRVQTYCKTPFRLLDKACIMWESVVIKALWCSHDSLRLWVWTTSWAFKHESSDSRQCFFPTTNLSGLFYPVALSIKGRLGVWTVVVTLYVILSGKWCTRLKGHRWPRWQ